MAGDGATESTDGVELVLAAGTVILLGFLDFVLLVAGLLANAFGRAQMALDICVEDLDAPLGLHQRRVEANRVPANEHALQGFRVQLLLLLVALRFVALGFLDQKARKPRVVHQHGLSSKKKNQTNSTGSSAFTVPYQFVLL